MRNTLKLTRAILVLFVLTIFSCSSDDDNTVTNPIVTTNNYPENGLKLFYKFNNNLTDSGVNTYSATGNNITYTTDRHNNPNSVAVFNGTDAYMELPVMARFQPLTSSSLSFWVKTSQQSRFDLFDQRTGSFSSDAYNFGVIFNGSNGGEISYSYPNYNTQGVTSYTANSNIVSNDEWHHIVLIKDTQNEVMKLYIDNVEANSEALVQDVDFTVNGILLLGKNYADSSYFEGLLDDVFIYDRALTVAEINTLFNYSE